MASVGDREKTEKNKITSQVKHIPKDAQVIMSILKELGILDYEPRVINQLLEFTYRYVTCILDDAKVYANHGKKKTIDLEDVKLATHLLLDKSFTTPPPRDVLLEISRAKNNIPLPLIKPHCGLRLPPDRYCLSSCNYKLRAATQLKKMKKPTASDSLLNRPFKTATPKIEKTIKRPIGSLGPQPKSIQIPKPLFKFSTTAKTIPMKPKIESDIKMEIDEEEEQIGGIKRKHEEDDFEIV